MDVSRFVRGLSVPPSVPVTVAHVSKAAAPAQVTLNQRKLSHPYMFLRPLSHLIWPGKGNSQNSNSMNDGNLRKERKFREGRVASLKASPTTEDEEKEEEERNMNWVLKGLSVGTEPEFLEEEQSTSEEQREKEHENWVMKILRVRSIWEEEGAYRTADIESEDGSDDVEEDHDFGCPVLDDDDQGGNVVIDRDSFGSFLEKVSLDEAKVYARMSYLSNLAYCIERIKAQNLLKRHQLRFVTSSLETKKPTNSPKPSKNQSSKSKSPKPQINPSEAYTSAASAASYFHSDPVGKIEESFKATTNSVTAVVSAKEETKEEIAKDLNLGQSSCCEWYVCDDEKSNTRYFVIQGSESIASWQANLLFEPVQFEGLDVLVHRGIYEAAKGIYSQMLPFIKSSTHLKLRFTGHSLGGSLSLLINLMLLIRGEVSLSSLLPVVTFGAPAVMCGGDYLLAKLGLGKNHVCGITMHRDIVPRAFSCNYPDHVARILKAVNGNFRKHPCLTNQKLLYAPMGKLVILQPDERVSPPHHLLPMGCGLYLFNGSGSDPVRVRSALSAFLNSPHPLEILSDRGAYGPEGTVLRDHDMNSYLKSLRCVIRQELRLIRKNKEDQKPYVWWPLVMPSGTDPCIIMSSSSRSDSSHTKFDFSGMFHGGKETLTRFRRLVASRHVHLMILVLLPARLLILGPLSLVRLI